MKILVRGVVQGVGFRPQVARVARRLGLKGYVKNVGSYVEIFLEDGSETFLREFQHSLPPLASIESVEVVDESPSVLYNGFEIAESATGYKNYMFPYDTALCPECLSDVFDGKGRRHNYPFTNCVNCGARYSVISDLPYDRQRTSMSDFPMCRACKREFEDDTDRRYDAQTISCPSCGPVYSLHDRNGTLIQSADPILSYAEALDSGLTGVAKSWGGMHISVTLEKAESFRSWYGRPTKPFAIMVRDAEAARNYALVGDEEEKLLLSNRRPIVLLKKKSGSDARLEAVSPGLPNVGIYLPYSGMHHMLFSRLKHDAIISTSGNFPGEPMVVDNESAFDLGADIYLLHNRRIVNRTDDSVVRRVSGRTMFIRKSRGYVPDILSVGYQGSYLSLGAEMNSRLSLTKDGYLFSSQYLGDISNYNNMMFLEHTAHSFMKMLDVSRLDGIAIDMHPLFAYRRFASELAEASGITVTETQHHHAHAASLLLDSSREQLVAVALDGTGYGTDSRIWGGEILDARAAGISRIASIQEFPLPGGEAAIREPMRMVYGMNEILGRPLELDYDTNLYSKLVQRSVMTTSFGRVLDALSAYLGVCDRMRYDGEPAMKLESLLDEGREKFHFSVDTVTQDGRKVFQVLPMFEELFTMKLHTVREKADAAHSFVKALVRRMAEFSADYAVCHDMNVGLTGGVSYNSTVTEMFTEAAGQVDVVLHSRVPNGDNGISAGQNLILAATGSGGT